MGLKIMSAVEARQIIRRHVGPDLGPHVREAIQRKLDRSMGNPKAVERLTKILKAFDIVRPTW